MITQVGMQFRCLNLREQYKDGMGTRLEWLSWKQCTGLEEQTIKWLENCTQAQKVSEDPIIHLIAVNEHCTFRSVLGPILFNIFIDDQVDDRVQQQQICRWF